SPPWRGVRWIGSCEVRLEKGHAGSRAAKSGLDERSEPENATLDARTSGFAQSRGAADPGAPNPCGDDSRSVRWDGSAWGEPGRAGGLAQHHVAADAHRLRRPAGESELGGEDTHAM